MNFRNRKIFSLFLSLALVLGVVVGATPAFADETDVQHLTIVHVNDVHGRVELDERDQAVGYARLKTKVDELKEENPNLLLLNAGDTVHGTTLVNVTQGETMVNLMDLVGFDAMVPGNHDFNYGYERLLELKKMAKFPIIAANVTKESDGSSDFDAYIIREMENGLKVAIFGLATEETKYKSHPDNTKGINIDDPVKAAEKAVKELKEKDVDFIIALGHLGIEGSLTTTSKEVAQKVDGIDLFVDGHSHEILNEVHNGTLLVQTESYIKNIGIVDIEIKDGKVEKKEAKLIPFEEAKEYEPNKEIEEAIAKIEEINKPIVSVVVGKSTVNLDGERADVRTKETNLGNLIADAMLKSTEADIAFTNGGGIRASIGEGDITVNDILTAFPFTNTLAVIEVTGAELIQALERGVDTYPDEAGHFPHVSGMSYKFDPEKEIGSRINEVLVDGKKVETDKTYKLVTNDFMAAGGDGYTMFEGKPFIAEGGLLSDILVDYFDEVNEVNPVVEGRIKVGKVEEAKPEPQPEPKPEPTPEIRKYVVKPGDVLWRIGRQYNKTWQELANFNNLANPHLIYPNQVINVPN